jgi:predicted Zn-ribbon and HTH transcriptional regulator
MKPDHPASDHVAPASETPRQAMHRLLRTAPRTALELSALVHVPERDVAAHLEHLARSLRRGDERLRVEPARCLGCGHVFRERGKLTRPGACPRCRSGHIAAPAFEITRRPG